MHATNMTIEQLEHYIGLLGINYAHLGEHYVARQTAWAEQLLLARGVK